jgi:hypothetical protein
LYDTDKFRDFPYDTIFGCSGLGHRLTFGTQTTLSLSRDRHYLLTWFCATNSQDQTRCFSQISCRAALKPPSQHSLLAKLVKPQVALPVRPRRPLIRGPSFSSCKKPARCLTFCYLATENVYTTRATASICLGVLDHTFPARPVTGEETFSPWSITDLLGFLSLASAGDWNVLIQSRAPHVSCLWLGTAI